MITCPSCGAQVPDQDRCPACDYPIILRRGEVTPPAPPPVQPPAQPPVQPQAFGAGGADPYRANPFTPPPGGGYQGGYADAPLPGLAGGGQQPGYPAGQQPGYPAGQQPAGYYPGDGYPTADGTVVCPNPACRHQNPARRTLCERCGWYLRPQPVPEPATPFEPGPAPSPQPSRSKRTPVILAGVAVALLATGGFAVSRLLSIGDGDGSNTPAATKPAASSPSAQQSGPETFVVPASRITAKASSVQKKAGSVTYGPANLLDKKLQTAWNSNGDKVGDGKGVTLTFTFDEPLHLRGIGVFNGYQKPPKNGGKDLYAANGRVAGFEVVTDEQTAQWALEDVRDPQKLEQDLGVTTKVTLTVTDVYPGDEFKDLALSEISFLAQR